MPFEMEEQFKGNIIELEETFTFDDIKKVITESLADDQNLRRMAASSILVARQFFTCEHKTSRMLFSMDEYNNGFRGYYFPFGVRYGCHSYYSGNIIYERGKLDLKMKPNPWCTIQSAMKLGCFQISDKTKLSNVFSSSEMTIDICINKCREGDHTLAGIFDGDKCGILKKHLFNLIFFYSSL